MTVAARQTFGEVAADAARAASIRRGVPASRREGRVRNELGPGAEVERREVNGMRRGVGALDVQPFNRQLWQRRAAHVVAPDSAPTWRKKQVNEPAERSEA
jgi:hypothetical protein